MANEDSTNEVVAEESRGGTKITCLVMVILIVVAGALFLVRAVRDAREAARDMTCRGHLKQLGLALHNYHQAHGCFPPAYVTDAEGKPTHSWRVLIMPFIEGDYVYKNYRFDEHWDSPNNHVIVNKTWNPFHCPSQSNVDHRNTNYVMIVGPNTISDGPHSRKFEDITDGTSNTLLLVEVANSGIRWNEPRDLRFDEIDFNINGEKRPGIGSHHPGKVNVVMCDNAVMSLSETTPPDVVKALATIDGDEEVELPRE